MMPPMPLPSLEEVLDAFAVEPNHGRGILEYYLRDYPQYAETLVDLSHQLSRAAVESSGPLSALDQSQIENAWKRHSEASLETVADPLSSLSLPELRHIAQSLEVPRQVIAAFRERKVLIATVPKQFLVRFAASLNSPLEGLLNALAMPYFPSPGRSYKADVKPEVAAPVSFSQLLIDANVPEEKRMVLLEAD